MRWNFWNFPGQNSVGGDRLWSKSWDSGRSGGMGKIFTAGRGAQGNTGKNPAPPQTLAPNPNTHHSDHDVTRYGKSYHNAQSYHHSPGLKIWQESQNQFLQICDGIKQNQSQIGNIDFKIEPNKADPSTAHILGTNWPIWMGFTANCNSENCAYSLIEKYKLNLTDFRLILLDHTTYFPSNHIQ